MAKDTCRGSAWWQEIRPHSRSPSMTEIDMEAGVPMLRMYSRCTGDTLRSTEKLRSRGSAARFPAPSAARMGTGR